MNDIDRVTKNINKIFPIFIRPIDLIECGLFKSRSAISVAMRRGQAPPSIRISSNKIAFPRESLCDWLRKKAGFVDEVPDVKS